MKKTCLCGSGCVSGMMLIVLCEARGVGTVTTSSSSSGRRSGTVSASLVTRLAVLTCAAASSTSLVACQSSTRSDMSGVEAPLVSWRAEFHSGHDERLSSSRASLSSLSGHEATPPTQRSSESTIHMSTYTAAPSRSARTRSCESLAPCSKMTGPLVRRTYWV